MAQMQASGGMPGGMPDLGENGDDDEDDDGEFDVFFVLSFLPSLSPPLDNPTLFQHHLPLSRSGLPNAIRRSVAFRRATNERTREGGREELLELDASNPNPLLPLLPKT